MWGGMPFSSASVVNIRLLSALAVFDRSVFDSGLPIGVRGAARVVTGRAVFPGAMV